MSKPIVAVVGRPNVGKSTFFNKIVGRRVSIVEDTPGVTRDRIYAEAEWLGKSFALIDTGGIEPDSTDVILSQMRAQAEIAMEMADVILFMVDGKAGLTSSDREVASMLMKTGKEVILIVNKIDTAKLTDDFYDFYELGLGEPIPMSAVNMFNLGDILDMIIAKLPNVEDAEEDDTTKIAVIGKPNVGKSSLINALLEKNELSSAILQEQQEIPLIPRSPEVKISMSSLIQPGSEEKAKLPEILKNTVLSERLQPLNDATLLF